MSDVLGGVSVILLGRLTSSSATSVWIISMLISLSMLVVDCSMFRGKLIVGISLQNIVIY